MSMPAVPRGLTLKINDEHYRVKPRQCLNYSSPFTHCGFPQPLSALKLCGFPQRISTLTRYGFPQLYRDHSGPAAHNSGRYDLTIRELSSISTATLPLLPNTYSHNTWIKNGGIPIQLPER
jgi:hypothetical protein